MEKRTVLAIALSMGIFIIWTIVQSVFFTKPTDQAQVQPKQQADVTETVADTKTEVYKKGTIMPVEMENSSVKDEVITSQVYKAMFNTRGGLLSSLELLDPQFIEKDGYPIDMVFNAETDLYPFSIKFGDYDTSKDVFEIKNMSNNSISFSKKYFYKISEEEDFYFTLTKIFSITDEYSLSLKVLLESENKEDLPLNFNNNLYTLYYGPQIGPEFVTLDQTGRTELRRYTYYQNGRKDMTGDVDKRGGFVPIKDRFDWAAIEGKYFISIIYPHNDVNFPNMVGFQNDNILSLPASSSIVINRPNKSLYKYDDSYFFYIGPKRPENLSVFSDRFFDKAIPGDFWGWLIAPLKFILNLIYGVVNNYGIAIIILTLLIKIAFFPLTQKSLKSTSKMSQLSPKINEIKEKYKDNPQKMNAEMGELYKNEGINPLSGCLPWLIQLPIFLSFYGMLNSHFDLRGAAFIPGWIDDLSSPESILHFENAISFLIINISDIRLLPIIMLGVSVVQQIFLQNPSTQTGQTKMLMYSMPIIFFFILYNMPSGLVLYWTMQNIFSAIQQVYNNYKMKMESKNLDLKKAK